MPRKKKRFAGGRVPAVLTSKPTYVTIPAVVEPKESSYVRHGVSYEPARLRHQSKELMAYVEDRDKVLADMVFLQDEPEPGDPEIEQKEQIETGVDGERHWTVSFNGVSGIMKECTDIEKSRGAFSLLVKEVCMFKVLQNLQGKSVPELLGFGFSSASVFFLVHSFEGSQIVTPITYAVLDSAERSLMSLHKQGWLLGRIQPASFAVKNDRVKLTCLRHCEPVAEYNRRDVAKEVQSLRTMLTPPKVAEDGTENKEEAGRQEGSSAGVQPMEVEVEHAEENKEEPKQNKEEPKQNKEEPGQNKEEPGQNKEEPGQEKQSSAEQQSPVVKTEVAEDGSENGEEQMQQDQSSPLKTPVLKLKLRLKLSKPGNDTSPPIPPSDDAPEEGQSPK